jgi:hypothetical protein
MAGKMQAVNFGSVEEMLDFLPENERKITEVLRGIVLECLPDVTEYLSFNVPFYKYKKVVCFIWPGAVLWGKKRAYEGVRLGFNNAQLLDDPRGFISMEARKQIGYHDYHVLQSIDRDVLREYLFAAYELAMENKFTNPNTK